MRLTDGYAAAAPLLSEALRRYRAQPQDLDSLCVAYNLVAMDLWDDHAGSSSPPARLSSPALTAP